MFKKSVSFILMLFLLSLCLGVVCASENITDSVQDIPSEEPLLADDAVGEAVSQVNESDKITTTIDSDSVVSYYKEKTTFVSYLKDSNNQAIQNKTIKIQINDKIYNTISDKNGKSTLALNLKPGTYKVKATFDGDDVYNASTAFSTVKIKKAPLAIKMSNYEIYQNSGLFFKIKVYNKLTKNMVGDIKVKFKVYNTKTKKYSYYWATTDKNGVAQLKKNFKAGTYKISAKIQDSKNKKYISYKNSNSKVTFKVKSSAGEDCCSFFLQVSANEAVNGFRRDSTSEALVKIKALKFAGKSAIKQYKTGFFHSITTADGWMIGNGGIDGSSSSISKLAEKMVKSNKIDMSIVKKIQRYKKNVRFGHFSIKAPNGKFAVVWHNGIITGKLKSGEYISCPNIKSFYRHGTFAKFGKDIAKAAIKVGATDRYGVNRRDVYVYHWKTSTDKNLKISSAFKLYAANDNGKLVGRSTANLKDSFSFKNKITNKNSLPKTPNMKYIGEYRFGNIDKLVKVSTKITAPEVTNTVNLTKYFKVAIKNKKTGKAVSNLNIKIKISNGTKTNVYKIKTNSNGVAKFNTKNLSLGSYSVVLAPVTAKYVISGSSKITIVE